jgi:hypothetical protein
MATKPAVGVCCVQDVQLGPGQVPERRLVRRDGIGLRAAALPSKEGYDGEKSAAHDGRCVDDVINGETEWYAPWAELQQLVECVSAMTC